MIDLTKRENIIIGLLVEIQTKEDKDETLTRGYVKKVLSKKECSKGIKVELSSGEIGYVKNIVTKDLIKKENFKFYNEFLNYCKIFSIYDREKNIFFEFDRQNKNTGKLEKIAFLFTNVELGKFMTNSLNKENNTKRYVLKAVSRKKFISNNFNEVRYFSINKTRKISVENLEKWEMKFKQMG